MATYEPVTPARTFARGDAIETEVFDLKASLNGYTNVNIAMSVAQFANHLGGTLLVGAKEKDGRIDSFHAMAAAEETALRKLVSDAVEQCCVPEPLFSCVPVPHGDNFLVAVNVEPSLAGVVGVRIKTDKVDAGYGGASFVFPVRVGTAGGFITPETMHNHMLPELRRTIILLHSMRVGDAVIVGGQNVMVRQDLLKAPVKVEENKNRVVMVIGSEKMCFPLPAVRLIYRDENDLWHIDVG